MTGKILIEILLSQTKFSSMQLCEYLLLGISFCCLSIAVFASIMEYCFPEEHCINEHLAKQKISPSTTKHHFQLRVEGPEGVFQNYELNQSSIKAVFLRTMKESQVETLYQIWRINPYSLELLYDLSGKYIGKKKELNGHTFLQLKYNLKAKEMYDTVIYLLEPNNTKNSNKPLAPTPTPPEKKEQLITQKSKGDKTLIVNKVEYPLNEYNLRIILKKYIPINAIEYSVQLWLNDPFHLHIVKDFEDKNTFGTYCTMKGKKKNVISILESLAPNTFFWTYIHEISHLAAYRKTGQVAHCATFYRCFKKLGLPVLDMGIFPKSINEHLYNFFQHPNRFSALNRWGNAA